MPLILLTCILSLSLLLTACSRGAGNQNEMQAAAPTESQTAKAKPTPNQELLKQIEQTATDAKGKVGVAALVLETGETVSLNPHEHFPMQSVYKLPIGMAVMQQVDAKKLTLDEKVRVAKTDLVRPGMHSPIRDKYPNGTELSIDELLSYMLIDSDGTASDVLMARAGGPQVVQAFLSGLDIKEMIVLNTEKEFGLDQTAQYQNWTSPDAAISLLRSLQERRGLSEQSQALLLKLLTESTTGPKRLKGLLPAGTVVAHKTGSSGTFQGVTAATNDIGLITLPNGNHLAIAVFVSDSPADEATRESVIARIAKAVWDAVTR